MSTEMSHHSLPDSPTSQPKEADVERYVSESLQRGFGEDSGHKELFLSLLAFIPAGKNGRTTYTYKLPLRSHCILSVFWNRTHSGSSITDFHNIRTVYAL